MKGYESIMNENEKKSQFHEALSFLVESANINNGSLTIDEIKSALNDVITDDEQYTLVYDYLLENKISIKGYVPIVKKSPANISYNEAEDGNTDISKINVSTSVDDAKEKTFVDMYYDDLENMVVLTEEEELILLEKVLADTSDKLSLNSLIEGNLKTVIELAEDFRNKGVSHGDLLQEGNLGLMEGILTYDGKLLLEEFHSHLENSIRNAINDAVLEQNASSRINFHVADRANELDRASIALSKELDRTPTLEELAKYLSLPEDEVERIMKMSLNALTIDESNIDGNNITPEV